MDIDHRPTKKRRFFTDESPVRQLASLSDSVSPPHNHNARSPPTATSVVETTSSDKPNDAFDPADFKSVVGADVPQDAITILQKPTAQIWNKQSTRTSMDRGKIQLLCL
jgi:hypothetical protein